MAPRSRVIAFGSAALLVVAGALCLALVGGLTGQVLAIVLMSLGLGGAVTLAFLEVGLSEDRERAREQERRHRSQIAAASLHPRLRPWPRRRPRGPA
jgi:hypothetical protein